MALGVRVLLDRIGSSSFQHEMRCGTLEQSGILELGVASCPSCYLARGERRIGAPCHCVLRLATADGTGAGGEAGGRGAGGGKPSPTFSGNEAIHHQLPMTREQETLFLGITVMAAMIITAIIAAALSLKNLSSRGRSITSVRTSSGVLGAAMR